SRCAPAPTWSTPPRAAAARTPGCWRRASRDTLPRGRRPLLDGALPRARRERRAPADGQRGALHRGPGPRREPGPRGVARPAIDLPRLPGRRAAVALAGRAGLHLAARPLHRPGEPLLGLLLAPEGARERSLGAGGPVARGLHQPQRDLPRAGGPDPAGAGRS